MQHLSEEQCLARSQRADAIIEDFEHQKHFRLPPPWRVTVRVFLLQGLEDHQLVRIFDTLMQVEHEAGRLPEPPFDAAAFARDIDDDE